MYNIWLSELSLMALPVVVTCLRLKVLQDRYLRRDKVGGTLLDGDLVLEGVWHLVTVPLQTTTVIVIAVEEVHLTGRLLDARVQEQHFQQSASAAFSYADDDCL